MVPSTAWENHSPFGGLQRPAWADRGEVGRVTAHHPPLSYGSGEATACVRKLLTSIHTPTSLHRTTESLQFEPMDANPSPVGLLSYHDVTCIA